jgi:aspartyl-tRNA(Asn)/glutamyl-tRNA(Gln) amidotransferase subunit A
MGTLKSGLMSLTLADAAQQIRKRKLSPLELTRAFLDRIADIEPRVHAFITVCGEQALAAARKAEEEIAKGAYRGPLHGIPYAVKDIIASKGIRTTSGSRLLENSVPDYDGAVIDTLTTAGAILLGKNNLAEFASGGEASGFMGPVYNPWKLSHTCGGSSSGPCASVASGMALAGVGTCTGGSIRQPASHTNVVGLKPTYGLVSRYGVFPLSWSIDHVGPLAKTVEDCALLLQALVRYDPRDPSSVESDPIDYHAALTRDIRGLRVGIPKELNQGASEEVASCIQEAINVLSSLGADIDEVSLPVTGQCATVAGNVITWSEMSQIHAPWRNRLDEYSTGVREKVLVGSVIPAGIYHKAQQMRRMVQAEITEKLQDFDVFIGPNIRVPAGPLGGGTPTGAAMGMATEVSYTRPFNLTGNPSLSVPCGFSQDGLPVGMQISGRLHEDATVLRVAHAYEQVTPWHTMHPEFDE